ATGKRTQPRTTRTSMNRTQWTESFNLVEWCNEHALTCSWHHEEGREGDAFYVVDVYVYVYVYVYVSQSPSVRQWKSLAPSAQSVRGGARDEEPVASASGSARERGEGEDPLIVCCVPRAYRACSLAGSVHSSNFPNPPGIHPSL